MNNPYRARPGRPRVDHNAPNYAMQNQKTLPPTIYQNQTPVTGQTGDSWEWGDTDNGNDSWNWSVDASTESQSQISLQQQQQHLQQRQQQPQYAPSHPNMRLVQQKPMQDNYYTNLNGNNRPPAPLPTPGSGGNTPRTSLSRESTPSASENYPHYPNYPVNAPQMAGRMPATAMPPKPPNPAQWQANTERKDSGVFPMSANTYFQPGHAFETATPAVPPQNQPNYEWNVAQNVAPPPKPWPNQVQDGGFWQEPKLESPQQFEPSWTQETPTWQQDPEAEHARATSESQAPAWHEENQGLNHQIANSFTTNPQNVPQTWPYAAPMQPAWIKPETPRVADTPPTETGLSNRNWQHPEPKVTFPQPGIISTPSSASLASSSEEKSPSVAASVENTYSIQSPAVSEGHSTAVSPLVAQPDENYERSQAGEPLEVAQSPENNFKHDEGVQSDLAASVGQLSLEDAASAHTRMPFSIQSAPPAVNMWPRQYNNQNSRAQNHANFPQHPLMGYPQELEAPRAPEPSIPILNVPTQPLHHPEHPPVQFAPSAVVKPPEIPAEAVQNPEPQPALGETVTAPAENVSQTGYDQWYNLNSSDRYERQPQRQWPSVEVENYEPQVPLDFVNVDQPAPVEVTEDSAGKVPPAEVKLHPPSVRNVEASSHVELDSYEFASNDRNTFLETGELTDSHHEHESTPLSQDDENDEVPSDIPFPREVPGQSSSADPQRNAPTGEEQYVQRVVDPRRNDPPPQTLLSERRDVPPGQERREAPQLTARDSEMLDRRVRSLPQSRNDPSGEERAQLPAEPEVREVPGRIVETSDSTSRQIPGGVSAELPDDDTRIVTGSQQTPVASGDAADTRNKREEALGASTRVNQLPGSPKRRDSYEDGDDEESGNSREENRDRRRDVSPERRRYDYDRKDRGYYDREYDEDYYYERRRGPDYERSYNSREDLGRETSFRDGERNHARDELDDRRRLRDDDDRRRRDERKGFRMDDPRRRDGKEFDGRYRDRDFMEKDRRDERRRRYDEYDPRDPRREYYDDPYARGSRPSSRSSYNDREYYMRFRDPYYGYNGYGGYDYGGNYNTNYYAYLENLRRTDPNAYAAWYNKYYGGQQPQQSVARTNYTEDRASVHSGQSSCEDRTTSGKQTIGDLSMQEDSRIPSRLTPTKFSTSHVKGSFSIGSLVQVHASYPADGERARVDILRVESLLAHDSIARELRTYPGPLIKGVTHKKTIIEYCEGKIKKASTNSELIDPASYILLYQLMIMLIQQNGNVVGVDIASLLLRNKETYPYDANQLKPDLNRRELNSQKSSTKDGSESTSPASEMPPKTLQQITNEFRNTLLCGLVQEALEYAMEEGLWGHALFLASKLDKRTHASVMTRFANSLPAQDPLQTLYQLHSGRVPASVTCVADAKWDDWRPHLAMIISNTSTNPEINRRAITTLGDTLLTRGDIYAAHFCYILAQVDFGVYGTTGVKLALIGANHNKIYSEFATPEAVMLTEIYEYARKLSEPGFTLVGLQIFKLEAAQKMVDYGLIEKSLLYLEQIAMNIVNDPGKYREMFIQDVYTLSERIKFHDPVFKDCTEDDTSALAWLSSLGEILGRCQAGEIVQDLRGDTQSVMQELETRETPQQWGNSVQQDFNDGPVSLMEVPTNSHHDQWQPLSLPTSQEHYAENNQFAQGSVEGSQYQQQDYWPQQRYPEYGNDYGNEWQTQQGQFQQEQETDSAQARWNYEDKEEKSVSPEPAPQITMAPSAGKQYDPLKELDVLEGPNETAKPAETSKKSQDKSSDKKASNSGGSWLGGWFSKLTPKPKNQMILPDDNNPTIVWDPVTKRWANKDEDGGEGGPARMAPPPKASELGLKPILEPPSAMENIPIPPREDSASLNSTKMISGSNMFKLQKGRGMRSNYIDVMNPGGGKNTSVAPTPVSSPLAPMAASSPQLFVPTPVNDPNAPLDFLTPVTVNSEPNSQGLSRWSSTSSLSREVQGYTMKNPRTSHRTKGPTMYDPSETNDGSTNHVLRGRYPPR